MNLNSQKQILLALKGKYQMQLDELLNGPVAHLTQWKKKHHYNNRLCEIERALEAVTDGSYGRCTICEEPISTQRLSSMPYSTKCFECELTQKI